MNQELKMVVYISVIAYLLFMGCLRHEEKLEKQTVSGFSLERVNDSLSFIVHKTDSLVNKWELPYPVYQFQIGDIDIDGNEDVIVGVIKPTHFDSSMANRIFLFKNYKGYVRPMWLGSKLSKPLVDFRFCSSENGARIRSVEKEKKGEYLVAEYKWRKFGLEFVQYIDRKMTIEQARKILLK